MQQSLFRAAYLLRYISSNTHIHRYHTNMEQFPLISWYVIWALSADNRILRLRGHTEVQRSICLRNIPIAFRMPTREIAESLV